MIKTFQHFCCLEHLKYILYTYNIYCFIDVLVIKYHTMCQNNILINYNYLKYYNLKINLYSYFAIIVTFIFKGLLWAFSVRSISQDSLNTLNLHYSSIRSIDFAIKGAMSMCVTFINIICIFACGIVILKVIYI